MDDTPQWHQVNVTFPDWDRAEPDAAARIAPSLSTATDAWFFIRKHPYWRIRYQPAGPGTQADVERHLNELATNGHITSWTRIIYEPEVHAFGGTQAMDTAHRLFHADSRCLLSYLRDQPGDGHRRELSLMLCSIMMRAARQDLFEQGDVWARVAGYRKPPPGTSPDRPGPLEKVHRLITADAEAWMHDSAPLDYHAGWAAAYTAAGRELADLAAAGQLHRGLRDVLAHHVIFAWNRVGLPYMPQSVLASAAKTAVFGPDQAVAKAG
jgi:thiopeptide-type bacteriocin biosynthesis protein